MTAQINHKTGKPFPRGARPTSRAELCGATPFEQFVSTIPASYFRFPLSLNMLGNDQYGDCVTAEEGFNQQCAGINISYDTAVAWATANGDLNGANLQPVIEQMQSSGFSQDGNLYGDGAAQSVNYSDAPTMQAAIYQACSQGGSLKMGVAADQLPSGAGNANGWFLTGASPDNNEDHCMGVCGYGTAQEFVDAMNAAFGLSLTVPSGVDPTTAGYAVYTWATIGFADVSSWVNISGEAWIRSPSTVLFGSNPPSPDQVYTTEPTPPPPPNPPTPPTPPTPTPTPSGSYAIQLAGTITPPTMSDIDRATLGPIILAILKALCAAAPLLPAPYNAIAQLACSLVPPAEKPCGK